MGSLLEGEADELESVSAAGVLLPRRARPSSPLSLPPPPPLAHALSDFLLSSSSLSETATRASGYGYIASVCMSQNLFVIANSIYRYNRMTEN